MAQNPIQFQVGLSLPEFFQRYGTHAQCEAALVEARWGSGFVCPRCAGHDSWTYRRGSRLYRLCSACNHQCSLTAGTVLDNTKLPLSTRFLATYLLGQAKNGISGLDFKRQLGVSHPTSWMLRHKLMLAMKDAEADLQLHGRVEMDDAFLGGERSGGKPGRDSENKVPVVVAAQTVGMNHKPHRVCLSQIPHRLTEVARVCSEHLDRPVTVVSEGLACFTAARQAGVHEAIVTGGGSASAKDHRFQGVKICLGNLKSAITGTYRHFNFAKYAARYFAEFQFRFNRREDLRAMLGELIRAAIDRPRSPRRSIREVETCC